MKYNGSSPNGQIKSHLRRLKLKMALLYFYKKRYMAIDAINPQTPSHFKNRTLNIDVHKGHQALCTVDLPQPY